MRIVADNLNRAKTQAMSLLGGRNLWGLADQLLISFTNFVTMILVARGLESRAAFGTFTLVYSALLFANIIQFALVTQPHNVIGATRHGEDYRLYTATTGLVQLLLAMTLGAIATIVATGATFAHASFASELIALVPSIVAWQLQEFIRRVLYTEGRMNSAFINDLISYGGQTLIIGVLWWQKHLTGALALWALAITSGVACVVGVWQIRQSLVWRVSRDAVRDNWHFGKWLLGSEILNWASSLQMYLYLAAIILGTAASGTLRAAQILFGPARVFSFVLQSLLPIRFARALANEGEGSLMPQIRRAVLLVLVLLGPYCLLLAVIPRFILSKVFEPAYAEQPLVLSLYSIEAMLNYLALIVVAALSAKRMTREIFYGSVWSAALAVVLSWPLIRLIGVGGAVACMMVSTVVMSLFLATRLVVRKQEKDPATEATSQQAIFVEEQACPS